MFGFRMCILTVSCNVHGYLLLVWTLWFSSFLGMYGIMECYCLFCFISYVSYVVSLRVPFSHLPVDGRLG